MAEAFKLVFSHVLIQKMAQCFAAAWPKFDSAGFIQAASDGLDALELKARSEQIRAALHRFLPKDPAHSQQIILQSLAPMIDDKASELSEHAHLLQGWAIMPMADYVAFQALSLKEQKQEEAAEQAQENDLRDTVSLLFELSKRLSSEFAIRYLLRDAQAPTLALLSERLSDPSEHVRRLISEGTRPRLPWGIRLSAFVQNPQAILPLLEALKDDPSEYVRRSVANNLNDIAKDHPDLVVSICEKWMQGASTQRVRLIRHACRTLFKQGRANALALFGYHAPKLEAASLSLNKTNVAMGDEIVLSAHIAATHEAQKLMIDYVIYHQKAGGKLLPKVFKWKSVDIAAHESICIEKRHSFKPVTTRKYYAGEHKAALLINGVEFAAISFHVGA